MYINDTQYLNSDRGKIFVQHTHGTIIANNSWKYSPYMDSNVNEIVFDSENEDNKVYCNRFFQ